MRGDSQTRTPAGRRSRSISGPRFRRKPAKQHAAETSENAPRDSNRPPATDILARSRFPDFPNSVAGSRRFSRQPETGRVVGRPALRHGPPPFTPVRCPPAPSGYPLPPAFGLSYLRPLAATPCRPLLAPRTPFNAKNGPARGSWPWPPAPFRRHCRRRPPAPVRRHGRPRRENW